MTQFLSPLRSSWIFFYLFVFAAMAMFCIQWRFELLQSRVLHGEKLQSFAVGSLSLESNASLILENAQTRRIAFMTASHKLSQYLFLWKTLEAIRDVCNAGFDVEIFIQAAIGLRNNTTMYNRLTDSLYCARTEKMIKVHLSEFDDIGFGLNSKHRSIMKHVLNNFDLFIYAEEDMIITSNHIISFVKEQSLFQHHFPTTWQYYFPGFLR